MDAFGDPSDKFGTPDISGMFFLSLTGGTEGTSGLMEKTIVIHESIV